MDRYHALEYDATNEKFIASSSITMLLSTPYVRFDEVIRYFQPENDHSQNLKTANKNVKSQTPRGVNDTSLDMH